MYKTNEKRRVRKGQKFDLFITQYELNENNELVVKEEKFDVQEMLNSNKDVALSNMLAKFDYRSCENFEEALQENAVGVRDVPEDRFVKQDELNEATEAFREYYKMPYASNQEIIETAMQDKKGILDWFHNLQSSKNNQKNNLEVKDNETSQDQQESK